MQMNRSINAERNLTMLMDFYELTMANGYLLKGKRETKVVFDMFYRQNPDQGGFVIAAGLKQFLEYIENMHFDEEDIRYLENKKIFDPQFIEYCRNFKFTGDIYAVEEGTIVYPYTPIVTVVAPILEAQLIETMLLLTINHQSLIATKANRIVRAAKGRTIMEFGARRAQGYDAAIYGARAAFIGGVNATATVSADQLFNVPAVGTMAHSWIQVFDSEYEAFKAYAEIYPNDCTLLIDTYSILKSGLPNAIRVAKEILEVKGYRLKGVRIDSGDLAYFSKKIREVLDKNEMQDCKIVVSNSIDEFLIQSLLEQGACIDSFGIGERLITSKSEPVFGGVYKLAAIEDNGEFIPRIKVSENTEKITNPGYKKLYRVYDQNNIGKIDVIALADEIVDYSTKLVDQNKPWKRYSIEKGWRIEPLHKQVVKNGKLSIKLPDDITIRQRTLDNLKTVWNEEKRFCNPHTHYVNLSEKMYDLKMKMLNQFSQEDLHE